MATRKAAPTNRGLTPLILLYSLALTAGLLVTAPWWLLRMAATGRYREGLAERLGRVSPALRAFATAHTIVWLHAVSVGEVLAATRLVAELEAALNAREGLSGRGSWRVVISTTTATGQALARQRLGGSSTGLDAAARVFYFPFDFAFATRAFLNALRPRALLLMESELWPRLLHETAARHIPVVVANARVSDRSFARTLRWKSLWQRMARHVTLFLAQSEQDATRFTQLGARNVRLVGNLKYDITAPQQSRIAILIKEVAQGRPIIVAGSTVSSTEAQIDDEESQVIEAWMKGALPCHALLVVAPRHPDRFSKVWKWVWNFPSLRATEMLAGKRREDATALTSPEPGSLATADVILLDTIGDLASVYGVADIAYVGGSLFRRGGHNPLEPAQFAVPVVMGASYENFQAIAQEMIHADAICIVKDEVELRDTLEALLTDSVRAKAIGERGRQVFESQQGATGRSVAAILALVQR